TIGAVKILSLNEIIGDVNCNGDTDGAIFVTGVTSGAPADEPYTFTWSINAPAPTTTATTSEITSLAAGQYALTMTDASAVGCQVIDTFEVTQPDVLDIQVFDFTNETCLVGNDGSITTVVTGGTAPYAYEWLRDDLEMDSVATGLSAGIDTIIVTDNNLCTDTVIQFISAPAPPNITQLDDDFVSCPNDMDGELNLMVTPATGTMISSISWNTGAAGPMLSNLAPGQYIVTVVADNACAAVDTAFVLAPDPIVLDSIQVIAPSCPGDENGRISVFPSGGTGNYTFTWDPFPAGSVATNPLTAVAQGDYSLTITDQNMCTAGPFPIAVVDPPSIDVTISNVQDTSCPDPTTCDGQATATATYSDGTAGNFFFTWASGEETSGAQTSTATQLCVGMQTVDITDGVCGAVGSFTIESPPPITPETIIEPVSCNGLSDGRITLTPSGGTAPYSVLWLETGTMSNELIGVAAGDYTALITDDNMCTFTQLVTMSEPELLVLNVDLLNSSPSVTCAGDEDGVITVTATGGNVTPDNPYQYTWNDGATGNVNSGLPAGTYFSTVTDFKNCMAETNFTITEPDPIIFSLDPIDPPLCFGDPTTVMIDTVTGGANNPFEEYVFQIDNNGLNFPVIQSASVFAGDHIVTVEDVNGCTEEQTFSITSPAQIMIDLPETITVELGDSSNMAQIVPTITPSGDYTYLWTPAQFLSSDTIAMPFVFPEFSQNYTLTIVNANGCTASESIFVELDANRNVYIPNIFSPNGDGRNDEFEIFPCIGVRSVKSARLFDRWGGILYEGTNMDPNCLGTELWDGNKGDGQPLPPGVYVYMIEIEFLDNVTLTYRGDVTLIR
ncbi:MAG: gliding motility-associated C-terminal domain-containing protein, partial [Bacteroidota bacterium]